MYVYKCNFIIISIVIKCKYISFLALKKGLSSIQQVFIYINYNSSKSIYNNDINENKLYNLYYKLIKTMSIVNINSIVYMRFYLYYVFIILAQIQIDFMANRQNFKLNSSLEVDVKVRKNSYYK